MNDTPQPRVAHLTLLATGASVQQRVEEQLEGGGWAQVVQQLQDVWLGQEPLASVESLRRGAEEGSGQRSQRGDTGVQGAPLLTVAWAAMSAASMLRPGGPGAQKDTRR